MLGVERSTLFKNISKGRFSFPSILPDPFLWSNFQGGLFGPIRILRNQKKFKIGLDAPLLLDPSLNHPFYGAWEPNRRGHNIFVIVFPRPLISFRNLVPVSVLIAVFWATWRSGNKRLDPQNVIQTILVERIIELEKSVHFLPNIKVL